jgi:hypothetical protein
VANIKVHRGRSVYSEVVLLILGLVIAIGPFFLYHICDTSMGGDCLSTGYAEIAIGAMILVLSAISLFIENDKYRLLIGMIVIILAALSVIFVTSITGTCDSAMMACNKTGKPGMIAVGAVTAFMGVIDLVLVKSDSRTI